MKFNKFRERLYKRVTESRWTMLYIIIAALQMIIAIGLEAAIFSLNSKITNQIEIAKNITDNHPELQVALANPDYDYEKYLQQFQSITHSNIWFMVFQAFVFLLSLIGLSSQNTIEIIVIGIINILLLLFALIQVFQSTKWINRINEQLDKDRTVSPALANLPDNLPKTVIKVEVVLVLVLLVFAIASVYLGYRLYRQFGWNIYKKIGANIQMQIFIMLLKLMFLLLMSFQILNLVFLFQNKNIKDSDTSNASTIIFQIVMVSVIVPMVVIAWWGVRRENILAMFVFALIALTTIVYFIYVLARFIISRDENILTLLDILGIALCIASMSVAYMAVRNFDGGLKDLFDKSNVTQNQGLDLGGLESGQPNRKPNNVIID
ncbi:9596_t:CDS:2, partial [Paraglomus occultum]